jgi:hypothetical protein
MTKLRYTPVQWKATVSKCPHCECMIDVEATSDISVQCVMTYTYTKMMDHIRKCTTISTMNPKIKTKKITSVSVMTKSKHGSLGTMSEWKTYKLSV